MGGWGVRCEITDRRERERDVDQGDEKWCDGYTASSNFLAAGSSACLQLQLRRRRVAVAVAVAATLRLSPDRPRYKPELLRRRHATPARQPA
uniref:Uncharacterized protein n=1 Tax=Oryza nivara TaxID=4536 RepID=A0A0E0GJ88_ORYNI